MKDLFVVYGSETKLLSGLYDIDDAFFIKIYKNRVPEKSDNSINVNSLEDFEKVFERRFKYYKPKRIIFIGAAFIVQNKLFILEKMKNINSMLETNIINYVRLTNFLLPFMQKIKSGQFIYLSSFRSKTIAKGITVYSASKAFGEKFFQVIGLENGALGIHSTSIRLGCMDGRMIEVLPQEKIKELVLSVGNRRLGTSTDVTKTIEYILENHYTNGGVIDLTSGISFI